jgi:YbbR domain-containing protein
MINNIKKNKAFYIVLSILIAIVLWAYVVNVENPDIEVTISDIPVTFVGENALAEENLMVISGKTATISLRLQGKRQTLTQLNRDNISITVDLSKLVVTGLHQLAYEIRFPSYITVGGNVTILDRSSNYVDVTLGRMVTKTVEVIATFQGSIAEGYVGDEMIISPETVEISGEELEIAKVKNAEVTLTGKDLTETLSADLAYKLLDYDGNEVISDGIQKSVETVNVTLPVVVVKDVPLHVELKEGGGAKKKNAQVEIEPSSITLSGEESDLAELDFITIGSIDLSQVLSSSEVDFSIPLPDNVKNISGITEAKVKLSITGLVTQTVQVTDISLVNVPRSVNASLVTKSLQVVIRGTEEAVSQIQSYNLRAVADLSEVDGATGNYGVPVKVYLNGYADAGVVGEYKIVVSLKR